MTENESIERLKCMRLFMEINDKQNESKFLEDDYIAKLKTAMKYIRLAKKHGTIGKVIDACVEYENLGTIEEFKALKERNVAKKPQEISWGATNCPICGQEFGFNSHFNHCSNCGQKLDWK